MNGKEELHSKIIEKEAQLHTLINKFILTPEINEIMSDIAHLRAACGTMYGHEFKDGKCRWCGAEEGEKE